MAVGRGMLVLVFILGEDRTAQDKSPSAISHSRSLPETYGYGYAFIRSDHTELGPLFSISCHVISCYVNCPRMEDKGSPYPEKPDILITASMQITTLLPMARRLNTNPFSFEFYVEQT
jgi:hypothetical protein